MKVALLKKRVEYGRVFGTWRSLVAHHNGVVGVAGSNPVVPTIFSKIRSVRSPVLSGIPSPIMA